MKIKKAFEKNWDEIRDLLIFWVIISMLFLFSFLLNNSGVLLGDILSALFGMLGGFLCLPTIMGSIVTTSDFFEDVFEKDYFY